MSQKYQNIYFIVYLSLSDLTFASNCEGIDNPFIALGANGLIVCVGIRWLVRCLLLDWYLGSQTEGNTYSTLLHHPFLFIRKTNTSSRSSRKNFWRRCRGDLRQVKTYQVPIINSSPSHYIICHSPLIFLSPHFTIFAFSSPSFRSILCYHVSSFCLHLCLLKVYGSSSTR